MKARVVEYDAENLPPKDEEHEALMQSLKELAGEIIQLSPNIPSEAGFAIKSIESLTFLVNFIGSNMNAPVEEKQALLEVAGIKARARRVLELLNKEKQMLSLKRDIQTKVKGELDQQQREYFLNQQLKQIQEELGNNPQAQEVAERKLRAESMKWPTHAKEAFEKEILKLERMNSQSAEIQCAGQLRRLDAGFALGEEIPRQLRPSPRTSRARRGPLRPRKGEGTHH